MTFANGVGPSMVWKHPDLNSIEQLEERGMEVELENKGPENFGNILHLIGQEDISTIFPEALEHAMARRPEVDLFDCLGDVRVFPFGIHRG